VRTLPSIALAIGALAAVAAAPCLAGVTLRSGDVVLVDSFAQPADSPGLWRLDPTSLDTTRITAGGLLKAPDRVAVDGSGIVYVADHVSGVVRIDAATGAQSVLVTPAALGGRTARGICMAGDGTLYVTTTGSSVGAVLSVDLGTRGVTVFAEGSLLVNPVGMMVGPDGALYVADQSSNSATGTSGSIVRIETSGAQSVFANGDLFRGPFDLAFSTDGWLYVAQWGGLSRRNGGFIRVRLSDRFAEYVPSDRSQGVTATRDADVLLGDCISISLDCYSGYRYVRRFSDGSQRYLPAGGMAVVPAGSTPTRRSTWGTLKTIYR
jgi:glucose/arabinose dehydrogenase